MMAAFGWAAGTALAIAISAIAGPFPFAVGVLLGFALSMFGMLVGLAAKR